MSMHKQTIPHRPEDGAPFAQGGQSAERIWNEYEGGVTFKQQLDLYDTVKVNEDFYVGRQWEGVQSNGLPTPVFNYICLLYTSPSPRD